MTQQTLDPKTHIGLVSLTVASLARSLHFYQHNIGLTLLRQESGTVYLGAGNAELLALTEQSGAHAVRGHTGLYHFALRLPSRLDLARALANLTQTKTPLQGFSDHSVSEAIYLADPDGNGIEIYRDRLRDEWPVVNGRLHMDTKPLNIPSLMAELKPAASPWQGMPAGTTMGHIHLHVSHLEKAVNFYTEVLGFDLVMRYGPSAAFVSAGGYHHHIGLNTWASVGAPPPPAEATGLHWYTVTLPTLNTQNELICRLQQANIPFETETHALLVRDPAHNLIRLAVEKEKVV